MCATYFTNHFVDSQTTGVQRHKVASNNSILKVGKLRLAVKPGTWVQWGDVAPGWSGGKFMPRTRKLGWGWEGEA